MSNPIYDFIQDSFYVPLETVLGETPVFRSILNTIQHKKFERRLIKHSEKIKEISLNIEQKNYHFFAEKLGPMVFEKIMTDDQEDKAEFLLLGYANCVKRELKDEDIIIYYFDLLSDLRVVDLKRLVSYSDWTNENVIVPEKGSEHEMVLFNSDEKLRRLKLVNFSLVIDGGEFIESNPTDTIIDRSEPAKVTPIGKKFLEFLGVNELTEL